MDIKWCECAERECTQTSSPVICSKCGSNVQCDFCRANASPRGSFPLGVILVGDKVVCSDHAWLVSAAKAREISK